MTEGAEVSLPKIIVLRVPGDTDSQALESVKALLLAAVPLYSEPDADELIKMADSARLVDLEAELNGQGDLNFDERMGYQFAIRKLAGEGGA